MPIAPAALEGFRGLMRYLFADLATPVPTLVHQPTMSVGTVQPLGVLFRAG